MMVDRTTKGSIFSSTLAYRPTHPPTNPPTHFIILYLHALELGVDFLGGLARDGMAPTLFLALAGEEAEGGGCFCVRRV